MLRHCKFNLSAFCLLTLVSASAPTPSGNQSPSDVNVAQSTVPSYPPDTTMTKVTVPTMARPGYLSPIPDPIFKTRVTRIADQSTFGMSDKYIRHAYSKNQPWNSDGSLIMLDYIYPAPILDGKTYKFVRRIRQPSQAIWSNKDPNKTYGTYANTNKFVSCNMATNAYTTLHTFTEYDSISIGEGEGNLSKNDRYIALQAKKGSNTYMLVYDIPNDIVVSTRNLAGLWPNSISMSQSGNYVVVDWDGVGTQRNTGLEVFDSNLNFRRQISTYTNHGDIGYDTSGNEVYVMRSNDWNAGIVSIRLDNGVQKSVLGGTDAYRLGSNWSNHISCRNIRRPGWCYYSDAEPSSESASMAFQEVIAIKLDGSQTVERFAHQYSSDNMSYGAYPMAVPNRDGSKVLWASEWKGGSNVPVYSYVAEMPVKNLALLNRGTQRYSRLPTQSGTVPIN